MTQPGQPGPPAAQLGLVFCHAVTMADTLAAIDLLARDESRPHLVVTANIAHVHQARRFTALRCAYERATLSTPDGWPVVLAVRLLSHRADVERVTGADLVPELLRRPMRIVLAGGAPGSADRLAEHVQTAGLSSVVTVEALPRHEVADPVMRRLAMERIRAHEPSLVLVGLGVPKQEAFALDLMDMLPRGVVIPVGAAIDFASGVAPRCPTWLRRIGLEWLFRLAHEPRRLWKRYALAAPYFVWVVIRELGGRGGAGVKAAGRDWPEPEHRLGDE